MQKLSCECVCAAHFENACDVRAGTRKNRRTLFDSVAIASSLLNAPSNEWFNLEQDKHKRFFRDSPKLWTKTNTRATLKNTSWFLELEVLDVIIVQWSVQKNLRNFLVKTFSFFCIKINLPWQFKSFNYTKFVCWI